MEQIKEQAEEKRKEDSSGDALYQSSNNAWCIQPFGNSYLN